MVENRNKTTLAKIMANQSRKRTLPALLIKDKQIANNQSRPGALADDISILENKLAPTPPNSPTMKGLQADMENYMDQSKLEELERTVERLKAMHATLEHEALRYHFSIRRITKENEWMKSYVEAADKLLTEKDAELRALIRKRRRLEDSVGWFGPPWTQQNP